MSHASGRLFSVDGRERIRGCLLGGAIGDALGAPIEFDSLMAIRAGHGADGVTGFVGTHWPPGTITDDTQMSLFTAEGLLRAGPGAALVDAVDAIANAYDRWLLTQGERSSAQRTGWLVTNTVLHAARAPGMTCLAALGSGHRGAPDAPLNDSKGCGAAMRVAPIGLVADHPFELAAAAGALTHGHPSGYLSAGVLAHVVSSLMRGVDLRDAVGMARLDLTRWEGHEETAAAVDAALAKADGRTSSAERVESLGRGWVGEEALAIALYCALVAPDVRTGLLLAVNHGGDSDSTGAIAGNLLGTMYGSAALPRDLVDAVEARDVIETVADDLASVFLDGDEPDRERYPS
jgi:ADP-ribosylglycohydrolase